MGLLNQANATRDIPAYGETGLVHIRHVWIAYTCDAKQTAMTTEKGHDETKSKNEPRQAATGYPQEDSQVWS